MSENVGAIDLELLLESKKFNQQLENIVKKAQNAGDKVSGSLKGIAAAAITAFSVKELVTFGKECIDLGSDLAEVQNVVDVTFKTMNTSVNEFAQNAIEQFGLGQTVAKKYVGTFGAMANAFGFSEQAAYEMSKTLTGLAGDVASFYNMSSDEAFYKLKSVFTGETETLKDLGVVMTQTALDEYALAQGFGKTTSAMSEQEKTALRYQFVLDKLSLASGDFNRNGDSWANQTRVLSLRFNELKATIGQGLINVFLPVVTWINTLLAKLQVLADSFKSFTDFLTGNKNNNSGMGSMASDISDITSNADSASDAVSGIGTSAKKSAKDLKTLLSFDTATVLKSSDSSSSGSGSGGSAVDFGTGMDLTTAVEQSDAVMSPFLEKAKELASICREGFEISFGDTNFDGIKWHIDGIKQSLQEMFTDVDVQKAIDSWLQKTSFALGQTVGAIARIGTNIAENFVGSIDLYFSQNIDRLKNFIITVFDISGNTQALSGNLFQALGEISDVFKSNTAKQIGSDIIAIFTNPLMSVVEVFVKFANDMMDICIQPILNNLDGLKVAVSNALEPIQGITGTLADIATGVGDKFNELYDSHLGPFFESIKTGVSDSFGEFLNVYNEHIAPFIERSAEGFTNLWNEHLEPFVSKIGELIGSIIDGVKVLWEQWLKPASDWFTENIVPVIVPIMESLQKTFSDVIGAVIDSLGGFLGVLKGIIDFIVGVFSGDWEKAWGGIKEIFVGIWEMIESTLRAVWEGITGVIETSLGGIKGFIQTGLDSIKTTWSNVWNFAKNTVSNIFDNVFSFISNTMNSTKSIVSSVLNSIKSVWGDSWNGMKNIVSSVFSGIWNFIKNTANSILGGIEGMVNGVIRGFNTMISALNKLSFTTPDWLPGIGGKSFGFNLNTMRTVSLPRLYEGGYFEANQPTLAIVGDNRTQAEIVSPVPKMQEALRSVLAEQGSGNTQEVIRLLLIIINLLKELGFNINIDLDGDELSYKLQKIQKKNKFAKNGG